MKRWVFLPLLLSSIFALIGYLYLTFHRDIYTDPSPEDVPALIESLEFGEPPVIIETVMDFIGQSETFRNNRKAAEAQRYESVYSAVGILGERAVPPLVTILESSNRDDRLNAILLLMHIGSPAKASIPVLQKTLHNESDLSFLIFSALALAEIGDSAVQVLINATRDNDRNVRLVAIYALGNVEPRTDEVLLALAKSLTDDDVSVRARAASVIGEFGEKAAEAVPDLIAMLRDDDEHARSAAAQALKEVNPEAARQAGVK